MSVAVHKVEAKATKTVGRARIQQEIGGADSGCRWIVGKENGSTTSSGRVAGHFSAVEPQGYAHLRAYEGLRRKMAHHMRDTNARTGSTTMRRDIFCVAKEFIRRTVSEAKRIVPRSRQAWRVQAGDTFAWNRSRRRRFHGQPDLELCTASVGYRCCACLQ